MSPHRRDIAGALFVAAVVAGLYWPATQLWWTWDDAFLLHIALTRTVSEHFFSADLWRSTPQLLFTPVMSGWYDALLTLFGLDPRTFYVLQLTHLCALAVLVFAGLRMWIAPAASVADALLFATGAPLCALATRLMHVHYTISLCLALAAAILYVGGHRRGVRWMSPCSAVAYLLAMLAKEIAAGLPVVLRVRYDSPEGWRTYSPIIPLDFIRSPEVRFER